MNKEYILYHIPGKKIGVTCNLYDRVTTQQGYVEGEYEILAKSKDIDYISKKEIKLQKEYGYRVDQIPYNELSNNNKRFELMKMNINVTEQTTTFPCPVNKLKGRLMDSIGDVWRTEHGNCYIDKESIKWIMDNVKTSMFNGSRCYVYNKAMARHFDNPKIAYAQTLFDEEQKYEHKNKCCDKEKCCQEECEVYFYFDMIREWAEERGIYEHGDPKTQYLKLMEEAGEVGRAILKDKDDDIIDGIGDMVVVLTNLAELCGTSIEECTEKAYDVISKRTGKMDNGTFVKDN